MRSRPMVTVAGLVVLSAAAVGVTASSRNSTESIPTATTTVSTSSTTATATVPDEPLRVVILGDSYTQLDQWASEVADAANWDHVNLALAGTGYVSTAGRSACGLDFCSAFAGQVDAAARITPLPEVVIVTGGVNDPSGQLVAEAVHDTYAMARELFPNAIIVGFSPFGKATEYPDSLVTLRSLIRSEVVAVDGIYVDVGHPLGGHPELISGDGLHPTPEGQHVFARAILAALRTQAPELLRDR